MGMRRNLANTSRFRIREGVVRIAVVAASAEELRGWAGTSRTAGGQPLVAATGTIAAPLS